MIDEMKDAKIAYIVPFETNESGNREPVLLIQASSSKPVDFSISLFFIGLLPCAIYSVSFSIRHEGKESAYPEYEAQKRFRVEDVLKLGGLSPTAIEIPVTLQPPVSSGQYRIEAILKSDNEVSPEAKRAISFLEIRAED